MKNKSIRTFWIGFLVSASAIFWLYWLWQQRREVAPPPLLISREKAIEPVSEPVEAPPPKADALETIRGIGPVAARRLKEAGIVTFAQLAASTPEEVGAITRPGRWNPADWIAEAGRLAEGR